MVEGITLYGDNKMSIVLIKNTERQNCTKYIDVQHHHIQEFVDEKSLPSNGYYAPRY